MGSVESLCRANNSEQHSTDSQFHHKQLCVTCFISTPRIPVPRALSQHTSTSITKNTTTNDQIDWKKNSGLVNRHFCFELACSYIVAWLSALATAAS